MNADNWDPPDHERVFYRHSTTGDLGWLVRRDGKDCVKYDRPAMDIVRPFRADEWIAELEYRPLTRLQLVQVAFEADKKLCYFLGRHELSRRQWLNLSENERIRWSTNGPPDTGGRQELFQAIMASLERYAGR